MHRQIRGKKANGPTATEMPNIQTTLLATDPILVAIRRKTGRLEVDTKTLFQTTIYYDKYI